MSFIIDKQTIDDLSIFGKRGKDSVYSLFNRSNTRGGAEILEQMFRYPMADAAAINRRSSIIQYFKTKNCPFPFQSEWFDTAEEYLSNTDERSKLSNEENTLGRKFTSLMGTDTEYKQIEKGVSAILHILSGTRSFIDSLNNDETHSPFSEEKDEIRRVLADQDLKGLSENAKNEKLNYEKTAAYDKLLRFRKRELLKKLLFQLYHTDVYMSVAAVATAFNFVFPVASESSSCSIRFKGVYHPLVTGAKGNDLDITPEGNIVFLTGANMAGKSTLMKSIGIAVFLAHMGFPIAASGMQFAVRDGLFTTINLADNLNMGYSHFYAEVLRVKKVAEQLGQNKKLFVIFDELFRGTNVKDAYEATVAITEAFSKRDNCMFIVSTHIIEAGDVLKERCTGINFSYLPTLMDGNKPVYTYKLMRGITEDRHGMVIINNEKIISILKNGKKKDA